MSNAGRRHRSSVRPHASITETLDTLRRGETLSDLFARHGVERSRPHRLARGLPLDPRRLRPGLVFSFRTTARDTAPTRISVRTSPEQRVIFPPGLGWLERRGRADRAGSAEAMRIEGPIDNSLYEALDAQVERRRSSTAATASGSPGTSPTSTPGRSTSRATSSPATGSRWCSSGWSRRTARSASAGCSRATSPCPARA